MAVQTLDSSNLDAIVKDATGEGLAVPVKEEVEAKEEPKAEAKSESKPKPAKKQVEEYDYDELGLTDEQRAQFSQSMLKLINKKHGRMKAAEEFAAAQLKEKGTVEAELAEARRRLSELESPKKDPNAKPKRSDFSTDEEYVESVADWTAEKKFREYQARKDEEDMRALATQRVNKARELVEDFDEVVGASNVNIPTDIVRHMQSSELLAEYAYYFAKHPEEIARLSNMNGVSQLVALGKIEAKLEPFGSSSRKIEQNGSKPKQHAKPTEDEASDDETAIPQSKQTRSTAPVINPLSSTSGTAHEKEPSEMNIRETISDWQRKNRVNLDRRKRH